MGVRASLPGGSHIPMKLRDNGNHTVLCGPSCMQTKAMGCKPWHQTHTFHPLPCIVL